MDAKKETLYSFLEELIKTVEGEDEEKYNSIKKQVTNLSEEIYGEKLERLETEETVLVNGIINSLTYIYIFPGRREELLEKAKRNFKTLKKKER